MLVFIHNNFKLDLTYLQLTFNNENQWFQDDFTTEISFPFEFYIDSDISKNSGFDLHYNSIKNENTFNGILDKDGILTDAVLKFQSVIGKKISATIKTGFSNFPSFNKKLSELPLEKKVINDIVTDAQNTIVKDYPDSNYNFPMIHTDKYDSDNGEFNGFEKVINKYVNGSYVENQLEEESNLDVIKNLIQPLPYKMHVLKVGIESAGYTLAGDILNDLDFKQALLFRDGNYYESDSKSEIPINYYNNQYDSLPFENNSFQYVSFIKEITVEKKGDYVLYGSFYTLVYTARKNPAWIHNRYRCSMMYLKIEKISNGVTTVLFDYNQNSSSGTENLWLEVREDTVDIPVTFNAGDKIRISKTEPKRDYIPSKTPEYPEAISLNLVPLRFRNEDGSPILSVRPLKEIDLTRVVPDMSFREFVLAIKNWGNYGFVPDGKIIYMNNIDPNFDRSINIDLSDFEIPEPKRIFHDERQFEIAFTDGSSSEKYKYDSVLVTKDETILNKYSVNDNVSSIKINALPLPVITRDSISTAHSFEDEPSKLRVVYMRKMVTGGNPSAYHNPNVLIPNVAETKFKNWLNFRVNSVGWEWDFLIPVEKMREITMQSLIFAYSNHHIFVNTQEERINKNWWRITAKSESLL